LIEGIRDGSASGLLPPTVVPGPDNTLMPTGGPRGDRDARLITHVLADPRFAPVCDLLVRLDDWCRATAARCASILVPGVLTITNVGLFGRLVSEVFVACATGPPGRATNLAEQRMAQVEAHLELFLGRLGHDLASETWPSGQALRGPVTGVSVQTEETHNGGQRVLCLELAGGGRVAYKPRPASGEAFFLATDGSFFALLNRLPPAAGQIRLPTLPSWTGPSTDRPGFVGYSWQEWVEPPGQQGVLRSEDGWQLTGTVLEPADADRFWHRVGALSAVCYALGVIDLHSENVLVGARPDDEPLVYPVDMEIYFAEFTRLSHTGLVYNPTVSINHHVGLENEARWCSPEGPSACWHRTVDGGLELRWRTAPFCRTETRSVVADTAGRAGFGPYLPAMLRGMFDAWTLLCRHRATVLAFLDEHRARHTVRVTPRPTADYHRALERQEELTPELEQAEIIQLERFDVPYFFRAASGGPVLSMPPPPAPFDPTEIEMSSDAESFWPQQPAVIGHDALQMAHLGVILRDAVEHVFDDVPDHNACHATHGVRLHLPAPGYGQASFDWPGLNRRLTYRWTRTKVRVRIDELSAPVPAAPDPVPAGEIRRRLLRLERVDTTLRGPATAGGFSDTALIEKLDRLTGAGMAWLREVVLEHGWPGWKLVGARAARVACRLVQHASGDLDFRKHCLELVREAANNGDMPRRDIAYLTDVLRLAEGLPQLYGTKFDRAGDRLEPYPIDDPEEVDARRAALGMEPLARYALRVRASYPLRPNRAPADAEVAP
jgi:hypothetical protein